MRRVFSGTMSVLLLTSMLFLTFSLQVTSARSQPSNNSLSVDAESSFCNELTGDAAKGDFGQARVTEHSITAAELERLKEEIGVGQADHNYNQLIGGHGTGLRPPTDEEWAAMMDNSLVVENVLAGSAIQSPSSVDLTTTPWFPPIGDQGQQGSCVAWAVGYYTKTFQEAKEHNWYVSGTTQDEIISPGFIYNLINFGEDHGSTFYGAIQLVCSVGACSWQKMPYNPNDYTSWPSEQAWREAPLYRGNNSGIGYMNLQDDAGLASLKNWLASGNLAILCVDAYKIIDPFWGWSLLDSNDMLTLDNYVNPSPNHAGTIVGYSDNFAYSEQGQTRYGAFEIANSWGIPWLPSPFGWEHILDGCYWISYEAMKQRVGSCMFYNDMIGYKPELEATFRISHQKRDECDITVGMGPVNNPIRTKRFNDYVYQAAHGLPFCGNDVVFDITEFRDSVPTVYNQSYFLKVYDGGSSTTGTIYKFAVKYVESTNPPVSTINGANVYAFVTLSISPPRVYVVPNSCTFDASTAPVGTLFNVTVKVDGVDDMCAWQVKMSYNVSMINVTRWYEPKWDPTYVFYGLGTLPVPAPPKPMYKIESGDTASAGVGSLLFPAPSVGGGFSGNGLLCIFTFNVTAAPPSGQTYACDFNITYPNATFWLKTGEFARNHFSIYENGYYEMKPSKLADVNKDGTVDMADISIMIDAFMSSPGSPNWNPDADANKDGGVDMVDISIAVDEFMK